MNLIKNSKKTLVRLLSLTKSRSELHMVSDRDSDRIEPLADPSIRLMATQDVWIENGLFAIHANKVRMSNYLLLIIVLLLTNSNAFASPGCMDNSWHLEKPFDTKEYHIVTHMVGRNQTYCQCPCRKLSLSRGTCIECGHAHHVQPWIIIRREKSR